MSLWGVLPSEVGGRALNLDFAFGRLGGDWVCALCQLWQVTVEVMGRGAIKTLGGDWVCAK